MRLARLAGARPEILHAARADAPRFTMSGAALLSSAALAAVSAYFVVRLATALPWPVAVLGAVGWGTVVLIASRLLLVSIRRGEKRPSRSLAITLRVATALLIGYATATPVTLAAFHSAIDSEVAVTQARDRQSIQARVGRTQMTITRLTGEESRLLGVLTGRADPSVAQDPQVQAATADYNVALANYTQAQSALDCELVGTCGTGSQGAGPDFRRMQVAAQQARAGLDLAQEILNKVTAEATVRLNKPVTPDQAAQAQQDLSAVQVELSDAIAQRSTLIAEAGSMSTGFLVRLEAFDRLTDSSAATRWSWLALVAMFSLMNALPFLIRYASVDGPPALYDRLAERDEQTVDELARLEANLLLTGAEEATELAEGIAVGPRVSQRARSTWQAFSDGVGGVFGIFDGTRGASPRLPRFEATIAADVNRLWYELTSTSPTSSHSPSDTPREPT